MNLGNDTVVVAHKVPTGQKDGYGKPTNTLQYVLVERCTFAPTRTQTDENRGVPSMNGATLIAQPKFADQIAQADHVLSPWAVQPDGTYTGTPWELVGDVGRWHEAVEVFLRRRT